MCHPIFRKIKVKILKSRYLFNNLLLCIIEIQKSAQHLRREHGMEALDTAFERCVGVLSASSKEDDVVA